MPYILRKEFILSASPLTYCFILFGLMFFLPGYPVLCGVFFVTLGIFQSFQTAREAGDILFSALLPIKKNDVVKGKYLFVVLIEGCALILMVIAVLLRMTLLADAGPYRQNPLMNANLFALALALVIFGLFNLIFVGGFFKTAYRFARPFVTYIVLCFVVIGLGEALWHFPGMSGLNAFGFEKMGLQLGLLAAGSLIFIGLTLVSLKNAMANFEKIDL
ncbi:MAG: ABC-2 transporter permease [Lachnospiraceae bacterium]|nr:ABC-2 transporter permease [Lachnospiraceae bacterium]